MPVLVALMLGNSVEAQKISQKELYHTCLKKTGLTPKDAFEDAIQWHSEGGGAPAQHCAASALMELGLFKAAANRLEALAQVIKEGPHFKSRVLEQAAKAWLFANDPVRAEAVATSALKLTPRMSTTLIARARARAELSDYLGAKTDLDIVLETRPNDPTALAFRAAALRYLNNRTAAFEDVNAALALKPEHSEALLERGILKRLANDKSGARADWLKVLELTPHTGAGNAARSNLEKMDVKIE